MVLFSLFRTLVLRVVHGRERGEFDNGRIRSQHGLEGMFHMGIRPDLRQSLN
jgi:hypothetical protein